MKFKNIGVAPEAHKKLKHLVSKKDLAEQKATIKEEAEKAIDKHVELELKKLGVTE